MSIRDKAGSHPSITNCKDRGRPPSLPRSSQRATSVTGHSGNSTNSLLMLGSMLPPAP